MVWKGILESNIRDLGELERQGLLSPDERERLAGVTGHHPMSVTPYYLSLIDWSDPGDPIRKMAIPCEGELSTIGSYDTSGERENTKLPGLQHKYSSTALVLVTNRCAVYCRHCFRKRLVGLPSEEILKRIEDAANYIARHGEISNVLLSGGDPFVLSNNAISLLLDKLSPIEHLDFIRFGTRTPIVLPRRILDDDLLSLLSEHSRPERRLFVVTQFNHPREITEDSIRAVDALLRAGVIVNNQSVLLKGVNDSPDVLADLQSGLVGIGVNPYYVFQCRPVKRVKNSFQVPLARGYRVVEDAKARLDGHSKRFKFVMSHRTGKIEVVGVMDGWMYFRYHEAKDPASMGKFFRRRLVPGAGWLEDLLERPPEKSPGDAVGAVVPHS
ncbi:MAG: KamA family radical SAM protein [Candidatus Eisenbacteria bacterium]|nr:KamA family radical SAM protein [Candidatus Eisenbacteria bacterium]